MRYYLDTNILVFLSTRQSDDSLSAEVLEIVFGYSDILLTSMACIQEFIHLLKIEKFPPRYLREGLCAENVIEWLKTCNVTIVPITEKHLQTYAALPLYSDHRDPNDRIIVAQAITDQVPLISSDRKFTHYVKSGLNFIFNER